MRGVSENTQLCGEDDHLPEERKKIKKENKLSDLAISCNYAATPGIMEESGNADLVVKKEKNTEKQRSEEQEEAKVLDGDFMLKEDNGNESIELATETSEANSTHSKKKKKKKEKCGGEDAESQKICSRDVKVGENNMTPDLQSAGESNDVMDLSFSKKKKKGKRGSEDDDVPEVATSGIDGGKESVDLSTGASNLGVEGGDASDGRNLVHSKIKKKKKKKEKCGEDAESRKVCNGDVEVCENYVTPDLQSAGEANDVMDLSFSKKKKKGKCGSEDDKAPEAATSGLDGGKESVDLSTGASNLGVEGGDASDERNLVHSKKKKKKKKEKCGEDAESRKVCNGDVQVYENNVTPDLQSAGETTDVMDLVFSKKKKKGKRGLEDDNAPEVATSGIDGGKESVDLSTGASNLCAEEGDAFNERNLVLSKKKMKVKHSNAEAELSGFCSGDTDGGATHSKKEKEKKNHSKEMEGKNCHKGDDVSPAGDLYIAEQGDTRANDRSRSHPSKKRKKEKNCSKETDEDYGSREGDGICPTEDPDCSNQDAEPVERKSGRSKKRKKEKSCSEEIDDKHCREEGSNPIKTLECCNEVAELDVTGTNDEDPTRPKKRKNRKHQYAFADAQSQTGEYDNMPKKGESSAAHSPEFVQNNLNECCSDPPAEQSHKEMEGSRQCLKEKRKKHGNDESTVVGRESGNVVDEFHATETNKNNLAFLEKKKRDEKKRKVVENQQACAEESNTEKAQGTDSQVVELVMDLVEQCDHNSVGTRTRLSGETSLVTSKKTEKEKKRKNKNGDQPILVDDGNIQGSLTYQSLGDTRHEGWQGQLAHRSCESKGGSIRRSSNKNPDCWLRFPKENSTKEDLFRSYSVKDSTSDLPESGTASEQIFKVGQKIEATSTCSRKDDEFSIEDSERTIQKQTKQVDGMSTSSVLYMDAVGHSRKKLLILDVNGILVDIVPSVRGKYKPNFVLSRKPVFKRPFVDDFLQFCFENFSVGIWSSRIRKNLNQIVDLLLGRSRRKLLFCWDQSHCSKTGFKTVENSEKPLVLKELRKLWDKHEQNLPWIQGDYNESNTLLLDDSPYKALLNPANTGIFPYSYDYRNVKDNSLGPGGDLRVYLERLAKADNVQSFVRENPFGQKAISESSTSWEFYEKVIGQMQKGYNPPQDTRQAHPCSGSPGRGHSHDVDRLHPPSRDCLIPSETRRSLSPQPQPQHQPQLQILPQPQLQILPQPQLQILPQPQPQPQFLHQPQPQFLHQPHPQFLHQLHPQFLHHPLPQFQPHIQFQPHAHSQPPQDKRYSHSLQREHLPYNDRYRPSPMEYPHGEITQPVFSQNHQDGWHSHPPISEYSRHDVQFSQPPSNEYRQSETNQTYQDFRSYPSRSRWHYRDSKRYQAPRREYGHQDALSRYNRRDRFNGRSGYEPGPRWH